MRLLVTGKDGQLARSLAELAGEHPSLRPIFVQRPGFDLLDPVSIERTIATTRPDLIVNAAAYTAVDQAEDEPEIAWKANAEAPAVMARAARKAEARLIHISTDYVFDGRGEAPYREDAPTAPINEYGRGKLAGEEMVRAELPGHAIVRTSWVYSPFGRNFVRTMLSLAETRDSLTVVDDQRGNPTSALDLAAGLFRMIEQWAGGDERGVGETFHLSGTGETVWADFARFIFSESGEAGGPFAEVTGIATESWPTKAARPRNSRLDCARFEERFGFAMPHWQDSVRSVVRRILAGES